MVPFFQVAILQNRCQPYIELQGFSKKEVGGIHGNGVCLFRYLLISYREGVGGAQGGKQEEGVSRPLQCKVLKALTKLICKALKTLFLSMETYENGI